MNFDSLVKENVALKELLARSQAALAEHQAALSASEEARRRLESIIANPVENAIRPVALTRKNALFAGHEVGAENWALLASIVATCKLNDVNPVTYIAQTLTAIIAGHAQSRIEDLMPWRFRKTSSLHQ